jgi:hypothetical protein
MTTHALQKPNHLREYLAGGGAGASIVAAALVIFLSVGAYVAIRGLPAGDEGAAEGTASIRGTEQPAVQAAATALGLGPGAPGPALTALVAAEPTVTPTLLAAVLPASPTEFTLPPSIGSDGGGGFTLPEGPSGQPPTGPAIPNAESLALTDLIADVQGTAATVGVDVPLSDLTRDLTAPVDRTLNNVVDRILRPSGERLLDQTLNGGLLGN